MNRCIHTQFRSPFETSDLIGSQFPINLIKLWIEPEDTLPKQKRFKIYYLFSMQGCQQCLKEEHQELLKLQTKFHDILNVHAICVDSVGKNIFLFNELYDHNFFLYSSSPNLLNVLDINKTPAIIFTNFNNVIYKVYIDKLDDDIYRKKFYITIYGILSYYERENNESLLGIY